MLRVLLIDGPAAGSFVNVPVGAKRVIVPVARHPVCFPSAKDFAATAYYPTPVPFVWSCR